MICLDTNYPILGLVEGSRESRELVAWIASGERLMVSTLVWFEFLCGPVTAAQIETMRAFVHELVPFSESHAIEAAHLFNAKARRAYHDLRLQRPRVLIRKYRPRPECRLPNRPFEFSFHEYTPREVWRRARIQIEPTTEWRTLRRTSDSISAAI